MSGISCLEKLEQLLDIDVDDMDPEFIKSMPIKMHDQTSNQAFVDAALTRPAGREAVLEAARSLKSEGVVGDWLRVYTRAAVALCARNLDLISGRVLLQTSPAQAYDAAATLEHARLYDREFARAGVPRERFCIKIPSTGPALNAAKILGEEGIKTLGTTLFSVEGAIACSQAGCLYVSPYYNEIGCHNLALRTEMWPNVADPVTQHPMSPRLVQIIETYRRLYRETGKPQPYVKSASFISVEEAFAVGEMGCQSATLGREILLKLSQTPYDASKQPGEGVAKPAQVYSSDPVVPLPARLQPLLEKDPLAPSPESWAPQPATDIDYLANNGAEFQKTILADPATKKRLDDALAFFIQAEADSKARVDAIMAEVV